MSSIAFLSGLQILELSKSASETCQATYSTTQEPPSENGVKEHWAGDQELTTRLASVQS